MSCVQSNWYKLQIRRRIYVVMSSQIMEWTSLWLSSLNKAAVTLSATAIRWFDARDNFEEFDNFFYDTFRATTLFTNLISSLLFCSGRQLRWWRTLDDILLNVDHKCSPKNKGESSLFTSHKRNAPAKREITSPPKNRAFQFGSRLPHLWAKKQGVLRVTLMKPPIFFLL